MTGTTMAVTCMMLRGVCVSCHSEYKFVDVAKDGLSLDDEDEQLKEELEETYKPLTEWIVSQLSTKISKATISMRLTTSPIAIVATASGYV